MIRTAVCFAVVVVIVFVYAQNDLDRAQGCADEYLGYAHNAGVKQRCILKEKLAQCLDSSLDRNNVTEGEDKFWKLLQDAQVGLDCTGVDFNDTTVTFDSNGIQFNVDAAHEIVFERYRREVISFSSLQSDVEKLKQDAALCATTSDVADIKRNSVSKDMIQVIVADAAQKLPVQTLVNDAITKGGQTYNQVTNSFYASATATVNGIATSISKCVSISKLQQSKKSLSDTIGGIRQTIKNNVDAVSDSIQDFKGPAQTWVTGAYATLASFNTETSLSDLEATLLSQISAMSAEIDTMSTDTDNLIKSVDTATTEDSAISVDANKVNTLVSGAPPMLTVFAGNTVSSGSYKLAINNVEYDSASAGGFLQFDSANQQIKVTKSGFIRFNVYANKYWANTYHYLWLYVNGSQKMRCYYYYYTSGYGYMDTYCKYSAYLSAGDTFYVQSNTGNGNAYVGGQGKNFIQAMYLSP